MNYKAIFFDWGGVIANDPGHDFLDKLLISIGATEVQRQEIFSTYMARFMKGEISEQEYWKVLRQEYNLTVSDAISDEFKKWKGLIINEDVFDLVRQAKAQNMKVAIVTNIIEPTYNAIERAGYYDIFDDVIASFKVGYVKPQPEIYQLALDRLGVRGIDSVFIDDKYDYLAPAEKLGLTTIWAQNPSQLVNDLRQLL